MSVRPGAPYDDEIQEDGQVLIYEGHNVPKSASNPILKIRDQELMTPLGAMTENGKFLDAAEQFKKGLRDIEVIRVHEKIMSGILAFADTFELLDAWPKQSGGRRVYKLKLELIDFDDSEDRKSRRSPGTDDLVHDRIIPSAVKLAMWKRDQGKCSECGPEDNLHFDQILTFSKGETSVLDENIQLLYQVS